MEEVSVAVKAALDQQKVPIKYWQWDGNYMPDPTEFGLIACAVYSSTVIVMPVCIISIWFAQTGGIPAMRSMFTALNPGKCYPNSFLVDWCARKHSSACLKVNRVDTISFLDGMTGWDVQKA
jgi:hypothetical protein